MQRKILFRFAISSLFTHSVAQRDRPVLFGMRDRLVIDHDRRDSDSLISPSPSTRIDWSVSRG
jgi:hypothetical protein